LIPAPANMYPELKSLAHHKLRAQIIGKIREFFANKNILEVDTHLMMPAPVTDPYLEAFGIYPKTYPKDKYYLQTSPEYAMKRLLCIDNGAIGSIYQICKAFRDEPIGPIHSMEFTMLEWYCLDFSYLDLINQIKNLLKYITSWPEAKTKTYQELFEEYLNFNPHIISEYNLIKIATDHKILPINGLDNPSCDDILMLLFSKIIEPYFANKNPIFVIDYPESQAALANLKDIKISNQQYKVAKRFELYYKNTELANGYDELTDPEILLDRFKDDLKARKAQNLSEVPIDYELIDAMRSNKSNKSNTGLPKCAGVALGVDRLQLLCS